MAVFLPAAFAAVFYYPKAADLCYNIPVMKKIFAAAAAVLTAIILIGCAAAVPTFGSMASVVKDGYEKAVYAFEINNGSADNKTVYTDGVSQMTLEYKKLDDTLAQITMDVTLKYASTPPYFAADGIDYAGLTDTAHSEVVFRAFDGTMSPVSVKKSVSLETSKKYDLSDKSFSAEFTYPVGKTAGAGMITDAAGTRAISIKPKALSGVFDDCQLFYLGSALMSTSIEGTKLKLNYSQAYNLFNLTDYMSYGTVSAAGQLTVADSGVADYKGSLLSLPTDGNGKNIVSVNIAFAKGAPLYCFYSLSDKLMISGTPSLIRSCLLLGYEQPLLKDGKVSQVSSYTLKSYTTVK